jgi:hypothetical protein
MYVEYHNHVPQARLIARDVDVRWGEDKGIAPLWPTNSAVATASAWA